MGGVGLWYGSDLGEIKVGKNSFSFRYACHNGLPTYVYLHDIEIFTVSKFVLDHIW